MLRNGRWDGGSPQSYCNASLDKCEVEREVGEL